MASKIEDYGMIGNTITCALVSRSGSIDWFCAPRFDSDACFTALVGYDEHGRWSLRPAERVRETRQRYRDDSMVLETEFVCDGGVVRIVDFMPMDGRCEEYEPTLQRQIGNFPQAFSHLALILTAQIIESVSQNREWSLGIAHAQPAAG